MLEINADVYVERCPSHQNEVLHAVLHAQDAL